MSISEPEHWLDENGAALYSFVLWNTHDTHRTKDLVQETLLAVLNY
ncbi:MAG: hypothetical protein OQK98_01930 [Gammaproteobacteria bacterium]|nr:hypothetical protein [Gammaproteobacteria bacterium]